jgi:predicted nucleic acid-binding protein
LVVTHLDTSFVVDLLREEPHHGGRATDLLSQFVEEPLSVSIFVVCELEFGAVRSQRRDRERRRVASISAAIPIVYPDKRFAGVYAETRRMMQDAGRAIPDIDLLIAVTALIDKAPLVTGNRKHFQAVPGLDVISY